MISLCRRLTPLRGALGALLWALALSAAQAQVHVVPATGGGAISADGTGGAWTALAGPELDETANSGNGAFGTGTIVLSAPAGFEFNPAATVTVSVGLVSGGAQGFRQLNIGAGRGNPNTATVSATTVSITVTQTSGGNTQNSLTWSGIQVRPTAGCALASGDITESGSSSFTLDSASLGALAEVIGARRIYTVLPGQSFAACAGVSGTPATQIAGVAFNLTSLVVADQWGNVDSGYGGSKTISYSGPTGTNSYTTAVAFSAGVSTTTLATTINTAQTTTITATDGAIGGAASSSFTVSAPLLHYSMDEGAWSGAAGQVIDDSGNGYNGTATNGAATTSASPAIAGSPGTCGYGAFTRANRNYVALPASFPNLSGAFTIAAWIRTTDNSQPGQRVMIDDQSNTQGWGLSLGDGGAGRLRFYSRGTPSALILDTPGVIASNTWYFVAAVADTGAKTKHVYVFSQAGALLSQVSASWTEASFGSDAGPASIGGETNASSENSASFYFSGNIDEVRVYQSALNSSQLLALEQLTHPCASFTHYAINLPGGSTGLTCEASQVTITAHDSGHAEVAPAAGTLLTLSTSTGAGVWVTGLTSGTGSWTPSGLNNGQATYRWPGGETNFTVGLRQNTPATLSVNVIDTGGRTEASTEDPSLTFADTAFRVTDAAGAAATLGTQISGKPSNVGFGAQTLYLQAMRTDTSTGACTTVFQNKTVSVGLAGARVNPAGGASALSVQDSGGTMQAIATGAGAPGAYTGVSLAFDAQSKAPLVLSYPDAGSVQLYASYALPSPPAGTAIAGSSNAFVVRPFGLRVDGVTSAASPSPSSPVLAKAGASFNVTLTAVAWKAGDDADTNGVPDSDAQIATNAATPSFGQESTPATATLTHTLNAPAGGNAGALGGGTSFSGFSAGAKTQAVSWSEVGFIDLHATSSGYLGGGQDVTNSSAGLTGVGRFVPDHFALSGGTLTNRAAAACAPASAFSYLGEGIRLQFALTAQNAANATTQNYTTASGFAKLPTLPAAMGFGAVDGATNLTPRLDLGNSGALTWSLGAASVDYTLAVDRASPDNPDGPFAAARIGIAPSDADGVGLASAALDMDVDGNAANDHQQVGASTQLLFGRLLLRNALGPTASALPVPISVQSWQGSAFGTNTLDNCSAIPRSAIALGGYAGALAPAPNCNTYVQQNLVTFGAGVGTLTLAPPAGGASGSVLLTPNLYASAAGSYCPALGGAPAAASAASMQYLLGRWNDTLDPDANAATSYDDNPSARAAFGLYGSQPDNLIFQRENY